MANWSIITNRIFTFLALLFGRNRRHDSLTQSPVPADQLIPREWLLGNPDYANVRLSPDGGHLAHLAPWNNVLNVWVRKLPDGEPKLLTQYDKRGIRGFGWSFDNRTIVYGQDTDGDENWRLYAVDIVTGTNRLLTDTAGVYANILATSRRYPDKMVIGINDRDPRYHDAYMIDLATGNRTLLFRNDGFKGYVFDEDLQLRLVFKEHEGGGMIFYKTLQSVNGYQLQRWKAISADDEYSTVPLHFDDTGRLLYWFDSIGRDKGALVVQNFQSGLHKVLYEPNMTDVSGVLADPLTGRPLSVTEDYTTPSRVVLDSSVIADFSLFDRTFPNALTTVVSVSMDLSVWLITTSSDRQPARYYLYYRKERSVADESSLKFLFSMQSKLDNQILSRMHPVKIPIADDLVQVCYLTLPYVSDPRGVGVPYNPLPMVLSVHGGPWARDSWGLNGETQLLANRGYAVLQCNFRGSAGYGKKFLNAGNGQWGRKMQTDLEDAVNWAVRERIALPGRVAIMGGSYGGYAALAGLAFTPDFYACGIDMVGPTNLITLLKSIPPYWKPLYESLKYRIGADPDTEEGRRFLARISPLFSAGNIRRPLLIAQGANDPRVRKSESDQIVAALRRHGIPVTYLVLPDEGHGFQRPENRIAFTAIVEQFLAKCLGGKAEPIGNSLTASNIKVETSSRL